MDISSNLTEDQETLYDKVKALEIYLRTLKYSEDVTTPPLNRDVVDYFLFDSKTGYCEYYSTAMVVMSRILGIPAREASGYAHGEFDPEVDGFVVKESAAGIPYELDTE